MAVELTITEQVRSDILSLQEQLLSAQPQIPTLLRRIHKTLLEDNTLVVALSEEELAVIVAGMSKQVGVSITAVAAKQTRKSQSKLTLEDL